MPITDAIIVAAIVAAFIVFGAVLVWGEYQTRHLSRPVRSSDNTGDKEPAVRTSLAVGQGLSAAAT